MYTSKTTQPSIYIVYCILLFWLIGNYQTSWHSMLWTFLCHHKIPNVSQNKLVKQVVLGPCVNALSTCKWENIFRVWSNAAECELLGVCINWLRLWIVYAKSGLVFVKKFNFPTKLRYRKRSSSKVPSVADNYKVKFVIWFLKK